MKFYNDFGTEMAEFDNATTYISLDGTEDKDTVYDFFENDLSVFNFLHPEDEEMVYKKPIPLWLKLTDRDEIIDVTGEFYAFHRLGKLDGMIIGSNRTREIYEWGNKKC